VSKFEEICEASASSRTQWSDYRERSYAVLDKLAVGFITYCQIPSGGARFQPVEEEEAAEGRMYSLIGATKFKDEFWCLGILLTLSSNPIPLNFQPQLLFGISVKEEGGKTIVKRFGEKAKQFTVGPDNSEFYASIVSEIKDFYKGLEPGGEDKRSSIGFSVPVVEERANAAGQS
jgi:hypothetical protein